MSEATSSLAASSTSVYRSPQFIELKNAPEIRKLVRIAFPDYRKLRASINVFPECGININSYWGGGSRDEYAIVELSTMTRKALPTSTHPYFDIARHGLANRSNAVLETDHAGNVTLKVLPENFALVCAGTFCGKPATASVYLSPANMPKLLIGEVRV